MLTNATHVDRNRSLTDAPPAQKVVIVNGNAGILHLLESVLDAGHYDVVFVEPSAHAYSQIKRVQPDLVILCVRISDLEGFHVLSMLKLDADTRDIPILTYTVESDGDEPDEELAEPVEEQVFSRKPAAWMN